MASIASVNELTNKHYSQSEKFFLALLILKFS